MRKLSLFIIIARWIFVIAGLILILAPTEWWPAYYRPIPMGIVAIGYSFLIALPKVFFKKTPPQITQYFQAVLAGNLLLCGLGGLGLWSSSIYGLFGYDKLVHFTFSSSMMIVGTLLLSTKNNWTIKKTATIVFLIIASSGVAWEFIESFSAVYLHFGYFGTLLDHDSRFDLLINLLGTATGLIALYFNRHKLKNIIR